MTFEAIIKEEGKVQVHSYLGIPSCQCNKVLSQEVPLYQSRVRPKKKMFISCYMPKKDRVGRSAFFSFPKEILWATSEENPVCKKKKLKIVKTVFFG